ncbi:MAG: sigma-70 family RNA polymerase sigma factor [Phycisphaerales bacterium]|nr:MAG: sigma-70 family RNA polymerase sigma factor [Phycisphaerales bacterium]
MPAKDGTLVLGVRNGDRSAFAELYDRRARLIRAVCYDEVRDVQTAADMTQEVFLRAYKNLARLHDADRFAAWLVGIARQVCREWRRKRRRERRGLKAFTEQQRAGGAWSDPPESRLVELRDQIASLLKHEQRSMPSLTERERLALHSYYLQERSVDDARAVLGLSRSGFYRVLSSACQRLRGASNKREVHP